ncbi:MAG TPA: DUF192 domain-containing protein [Nitrososphaerales archaeon]|nr:DUF192 domain-containing protein [Nitrososphaerales archaeon]
MFPSGRLATAVVVAVAALLVIYVVYLETSLPGSVTTPMPSGFTINGKTYTFTYVATTEAEREAGLMNRQVNSTTTMLFAFPSFEHWQFWMYDTNTSLDIIWVNGTGSSGKVVYLVAGAAPCVNVISSSSCTVYTPTAAANFAIEAKAGFAAANGITVGSTINFG